MNRLASETSPYLRQHRDNPVDWYPWGDEAFAAARERDVPILLSVGYSACHWCHVMAHECFEDEDVAARMNELFVNVKVDREERPDVDQVYMDAVQAMTGRGGWPMTVFLTPTGEPFYGGTYFPRDRFLELLAAIDDVYRHRPDDVATNTTALVEAIAATSRVTPTDDLPSVDRLNETLEALGRSFDREWGGFGRPPKFPSTFQVELLLRAYMTTGGDAAREAIETTLDAMCSGGIYDHLGGGFARYSTDREWLVPHFEKMLYDQALLTSTYLHALQVLRRPQWRQVVQETVEYVLARLRHPDGGFCSAEDADSPDDDGNPVEGRFYTWTPAEVGEALADAPPGVADRTLEWWGITDEGNFEGRSIPHRLHHRGELVRPHDLDVTRVRLAEARDRRPRPGLDDKVLTEWNGLFLGALSEAAAVFDHRPWLDAAIANAEFLVRELRDDAGRWYRSWQAHGEPPARHMALAADHAALIYGFTRLAEASGQARWIGAARQVADTLLDWFFDPVDGGLFTTAEDAEALVVRQKDIVDGATPSANSMAALALYRLAALTDEQRYAHQADRILQFLAGAMEGRPGQFSHALVAADLRRRGTTEVVVVGDRPDLVRVATTIHRPDVVLAWGEPYDSPLWEGRREGYAYVCREFTCRAPVDTVDGLASELLGRDVVVEEGVIRPVPTDDGG